MYSGKNRWYLLLDGIFSWMISSLLNKSYKIAIRPRTPDHQKHFKKDDGLCW